MSVVPDTTRRALELLGLLQTHRHWSGTELADRLGVSGRTLRRDIDRLRELGYRVESVPGVDGGYRLEPGNAVPPLLLTDEEAVTMAIGLRVAATQQLAGGPRTTLAALAKLEQVLPAPLRRRVAALADGVVPLGTPGPEVSPEVLGELALACRDHERVRFGYVAADGAVSRRWAEPAALVPAERRWYLVAWDLDRADWRTFRVDRLDGLVRTGARFAPRDLPAADAAAFVEVAVASVPQPVETTVVIDLPLAEVEAAFGAWSRGASATTDGRTRWPVGGQRVEELAFALVWIPEGVGYRIELDGEDRDRLREIATRMVRALEPEPTGR